MFNSFYLTLWFSASSWLGFRSITRRWLVHIEEWNTQPEKLAAVWIVAVREWRQRRPPVTYSQRKANLAPRTHLVPLTLFEPTAANQLSNDTIPSAPSSSTKARDCASISATDSDYIARG